MDIDPFWLIVIIGILVSFGMRGYRRIQVRSSREEWAKAADQLDLASGTGGYHGLSMAGTAGELQVLVEARKTSDSTVTHYRVGFPPLGMGLQLTRQAGWHGIMKTLGGQDIEVGDATFDDRFVVKANSPEAALRYFTPQRIAALNTLFDQHPGFSLSNDQLVVETSGVAKEVGDIVSTVRDLTAAGRLLQIDTNLASAAPAIPTEIADTSTRDQALEKVYETIDAHADDEASEATEPPTPEESAASAPPAATDRDAMLAATALFGENQLSFEVERLFAANYKGNPVEWSGIAKGPAGVRASSILDVDDDSVLLIDVGALEDDLYGSTSIEAAVALPGGATLPERGESVRFTGRLHAVDGLTKTLFVSDGSIDPA